VLYLAPLFTNNLKRRVYPVFARFFTAISPGGVKLPDRRSRPEIHNQQQRCRQFVVCLEEWLSDESGQ
jgi:hypothetical protein